MYKRIILITLSTICIFSNSFGQAGTNGNDRPGTIATAIENPPVIDGEIFDDPIWNTVEPITNLTQVQPDNGLPATEKTEIRIAYTPSVFYVSVICYDAEPGKLVVSDARRDASLDGTDSFLFILDTYNDGQNGFLFGTNSLGIEYDGQVDNEGQGNFNNNRQQGGVIGGFNLNWDASWDVKTSVGDYGWSAEFALPLRTLRFNSGDNQTWGINFQRNIRKTNEIAYWVPIPIQFDIKRLSLAGKLHGLNLKNPGNLKIIPYTLGRISKDFEETDPETDLDGEIGVDVKYSITPSLTLDLTYNTDFAQVEVDNEQVNLDRFNLFFPEKRPFFLENAGQFSIGSPGEVDLFFSRRIGIGEDGQVVPIIGGMRLSGKLNNTYVGLLSMFTEAVQNSASSIERNNFTVARVNHQFAQRSAIGAAFMNRESIGGLDEGALPSEAMEYNRTYALDGRWGLGKKAQLSGFYSKTKTPGLNSDDHAFRFQANYSWSGLILNLAYTEVAENFNPEMGFLFRKAFRKPEFLIFYQVRAKEGNKLNFLEFRPHISYRGFWNFDGFQETSFLHIDNHWVWRNGFEVHTGINITREGVTEDFEISDGVFVNAGSYDHAEAQLVFQTNPSKNVYINSRHILGGSFGGSRYINSATLGVRIGDKFNSEYTLQRNDFSLPNGDFDATVFGARLSYSFTPRIFTQSLIQYNSVSEIWSANIRFGLLQQANTGLFVVYNETRGASGILNRSFTIKFSKVFDVIK
ncbi:DUF5916 domain-containing protein [Fulvivirgaceae bacterium BMA10]|uniref:DUF5916 domain-containing protein n=1 Tax=Splendidivirga corallicola TaxID=3051826 RepID=A0ABT8L1B2_9BACT|nr:DUF5916 domain-containing protein [Fulvivirgaceae bacterium BMA10]